MKTIRNITYHSASNYGAALQCYALQTFIERTAKTKKQEIDYKIINYISERRDKEENPKENIIKRVTKRLLIRNGVKNKKRKFADFSKKYFKLTEAIFKKEDLKKISADYYITGSDQVWNANLNVFDYSYLLDFADNGKKISYAASCGVSNKYPSETDYKIMKNEIQKFSDISVRDDFSKELVAKMLGERKKISVNIDPTLLLDKKEWELISNDSEIQDEYIFVYLIVYQSNSVLTEYYKAIEKFARKNNLKVVIVLPNLYVDYKFNFIKKYDCGPAEFIGLIKNAKYVFSTSYHGTVFSLIFGKHFFCLNAQNDERIRNLLDKTNLQSRNISNLKDLEKVDISNDKIDYVEFSKYLKKEREKAELYLTKALNMDGENE